jgi:hypothetical protein
MTAIERLERDLADGVFKAIGAHCVAADLAEALARIRELEGSLDELQDVFAHDGECSTARFDRLAGMFYRDTRMMAPGKDRGAGGPDQPDGPELHRIYDAWFAAKIAKARAALSPPPTGEAP